MTAPLHLPFDPFAALATSPGRRAGTSGGMLAADVVERDDEVVITLDAPGVSDDDVAVTVDGRALSVVVSRTAPEERGTFRSAARPFGTFERHWRLTDRMDVDGVSASLSGGVLTVTVPKSEKARPRRIALSR